ncbi:unnamed protein product, partial [Prorocentrum cordatum]
VVALQDFAFGDDHREGSHQFCQLGWNALIHPIRTTDKGGLSCGTGIAVRSHIGMSSLPLVRPLPQRHRICGAWLDMFVLGGIAAFSLYLDCDDPLGLDSFQIPNRIGEALRGWQLPFAMGGDLRVAEARADPSALGRGCVGRCKIFGDETMGVRGVDQSEVSKYRGRAKGMKTKTYPAAPVTGGAVAMSVGDPASLDFVGPVQFCTKAKRNAERVEKQFQSDRGKAWRFRVRASLDTGAGLARAFTSVPSGRVPSNPEGVPPSGPAGRVDDLMDNWNGIWPPERSFQDLPDHAGLLSQQDLRVREGPMELAAPEQIRKCSSGLK